MSLINSVSNCLWACVIFIGIFSCSTPGERLTEFMNNPENGLVQVKQGKTKSIMLQVLPASARQLVTDTGIAEDNLYHIRLTLKTNEKITGFNEMQYMNFGIRNSLYAMQGKDTLSCVMCERIPGISEKEFLYITAFVKGAIAKDNNGNLRIYMDDQIAGWGKHQFEIKHTILQKLNEINN